MTKSRALAIILLPLVALLSSGCAQRDAGRSALTLVLGGVPPPSAREIKHRSSGLREQVEEVFFRADPAELKAAISKASFVRDNTVPAAIRGASSAFKELVANTDQPTAIGFRRTDLTIANGKDCRLLCAEDFTWAYLIYINYGKS